MSRRINLWKLATAGRRSLPHFVVIGAMKCGTTTLYYRLKSHPGVRSPVRKEIHFFDRDYPRGERWYRAHFPIASSNGSEPWITGEASPYYIFHPLVPERMARITPDSRLVVLLRNPVDRAYSHYQQICGKGWETLSFEDALKAEDERILPELEKIHRNPEYHSETCRRFSYQARGRYVEQLERWFQHFPRDQFFITSTEEMKQDTQGVYDRILEFLGLPSFNADDVPNRRVAKYPKMSPQTREQLQAYYEPYNRRLYDLLGRDLGW